MDSKNNDIARSEAEKDMTNFNFSFWLKAPSSYKRLQAHASFYFTTNDSVASRIWVDQKAKDAWQMVSIPVTVPLNKNKEPQTKLKTFAIKFFADGELVNEQFVFNMIGFAPAPKTELQLPVRNNDYVSFDHVLGVLINGEYTPLGSEQKEFDKYFTEQDVMASFTCMRTHSYYSDNKKYYDVICNDGTKRIANVYDLCFLLDDIPSQTDSETPYRFYTSMPTPDVSITTNYVLDGSTITVCNVAKSKDATSTSSTKIDYCGKIRKETDEYGITTHYCYDGEGRLTKTRVVGSDGTVGAVSTYAYDSEGRTINTTNGLVGEQVSYDDYNQVKDVTETRYNDEAKGHKETTHKVQSKYGVFRDKPVAVAEFDGETMVANNTVTYQNGSIRTVSDGKVKYGVKHNQAKNTVEYTVFDGEEEKTVEKNTISALGAVQTHTSTFYNQDGTEQDYSSTEVDAYGRVQTVVQGMSQSNSVDRIEYKYDTPTESLLGSNVTAVDDLITDTSTEYHYDDDGDLTGWELFDLDPITKEKVSSAFKVEQKTNSKTLYYYRGVEDYSTELLQDANVLISPRINGIRYISEKTLYYDVNLTYDALNRITKKEGVGSSCEYEYEDFGPTYLIDKIHCNGSSKHSGYDLTESCNYDDYGRLTDVLRKISYWDKNHDKEAPYYNHKTTYAYDSQNRLTREKNDFLKIDRTFNYLPDGRLEKIADTNEQKEFAYDNCGRLDKLYKTTRTSNSLGETVNINSVIKYQNDFYGNRTGKIVNGVKRAAYSYRNGGRLVKVNDNIEYFYDANGARRGKKIGDAYTWYYLDGEKLLREVQGDKQINFQYDTQGLHYLSWWSSRYEYVFDTQGNIILLLDASGNSAENKIVARYEYDSFGNCTVYDADGKLCTDPNFIGNVNPFRWKGFYFDTETDLYYANGSYYDPETGLYLDASPISTARDNAYTPGGLDRNRPMCNNLLWLAGNPFTVSTTKELAPEPTKSNFKTWLGRQVIRFFKWFDRLHWGWKLAVGILCLAGAIMMALKMPNATAAVVSLLVQVAVGVGVGVVFYLAINSMMGQKTTLQGIVIAALNSFLISSLFVFVRTGTNFLKTVARGSHRPNKFVAEAANNIDNANQRPTYGLANRGKSSGAIPPTCADDFAVLNQAMSNPKAGKVLNIQLGDNHWHYTEGWVKMQQVTAYNGYKYTIHYVLNDQLFLMDDFKIVYKGILK